MNRLVTSIALAVLLAATAARADLRTQTVEYYDGSTKCEGFLAYDDATADARPGVLVCPEWWGLTDYPKRRAEQLARLGYVAFVADIYGGGQVTAEPAEATRLSKPFGADRALVRRRAGAALDVLMNDKRVDKAHVAAIGYCFGGMAVLELARGGSPLAGVVAFHGSLGRTDAEGPDHITGKVLVCHGADDPLVPAPALAAFEQEMKREKVDYEIDLYGGAMHAFTNPAAATYHVAGVAYDAEADRRSWASAQDFLAEVLKPAAMPVR